MDLIINGTSLSSLGVIVENQTRFIKPKKRVEVIQVENQDGAKVIEKGYEPYTLEYRVTLTDASKFNQIYALLNGDVVLQASDDPGNYWNAKVIEGIEYDPIAIWKRSTITFYIEKPFRYYINEVPIVLLVNGNVTNLGNVNSQPILQIVGSGVVTVTIGGRSFSYNFDTANVTIDSEAQDAYFGTIANLKNRRMTGDFPYLKPGVNTVSWTGTVTSITFTKVSKWL